MEPDNNEICVEERLICPFYLKNRCRFGDQCRNAHPPELRPPSPQRPSSATKSEEESNKTRMRTAAEVINRINWDPTLDAADFLVVYLDRFTGLEAIPLTKLMELEEELAIPQHRIQQFCYKSVENIVWEKQSRLDYVFNSTDQSSPTLQQYIQSIDS